MLIVWMTSIINIARIIYLVFITFLFFINDNGWIPIYIFTFTALFPLTFYVIGFNTDNL